MSEETNKTAAKKDERIDKLATKVNAMGRILDKVITKLETQFGEDYNMDGVVGKAKKVGVIVLAAFLCAGSVIARDIANWSSGSGLSGTAVLSHDGTDYTLTVDKLAVESIASSGAITGVPSAVATVTNSTYVTLTEGYGEVNKAVFTAASLPVVIAEGGTGTNGYGSMQIGYLPEGRILVLGFIVENVTTVVDTNALDNADGGDFAFGTAACGGASGLSSTEVNLCPSTSIDPITNIVDSALAASAQFDGTTTAVPVYYNTEVDDADIAAQATNTVSFSATMYYIKIGDY